MTLLPKSPGLRLEDTFIDADTVSLSLASTTLPVTCPVCAQETERLHSHYGRTVEDLPWGGRRVRLFLNVRKFRCPTGGVSAQDFHRALAVRGGVLCPQDGALARGSGTGGLRAGRRGWSPANPAVGHDSLSLDLATLRQTSRGCPTPRTPHHWSRRLLFASRPDLCHDRRGPGEASAHRSAARPFGRDPCRLASLQPQH